MYAFERYRRDEVLPPRDEPPLLYEPDERLVLLCEPEIVVLRLADEAVPYELDELDELLRYELDELRDDDELPLRYELFVLRDDDELTVPLEFLLLPLDVFVVVVPDERCVDVVPPDTRTVPLLFEVPTELLPPVARLEVPPWRKLLPVDVVLLLRVPLSRLLPTVDVPTAVETPVFIFVSLTRYELLVFTPVDTLPPRFGRFVVPSTLP